MKRKLSEAGIEQAALDDSDQDSLEMFGWKPTTVEDNSLRNIEIAIEDESDSSPLPDNSHLGKKKSCVRQLSHCAIIMT